MQGKHFALSVALLLAAPAQSWAQEAAPPAKGSFPFKSPDPNCTVVPNGVSPDGQWELVFEPGQLFSNGQASVEENWLVSRAAPDRPVSFAVPESYGGFSADRGGFVSLVRWSPTSTAFVVFKDNTRPDFPRGAYSIYLVPMGHGQPGKPVDMLIEILKVVDSGFVDAHAADIAKTSYFYGSITDDERDDDLTFNAAGQLVIDCICTTELRDDPSYKPMTAQVKGLWDPVQKKFVKLDRTFIPPAADVGSKPPTGGPAKEPGPKIELVRETKPGSGQYEVLDGVPVSSADSGIGRGVPMSGKEPKGIFLKFPAGLQAGKASSMHGTIGGPGGQFEGDLVETAPNSGKFTDEKRGVTVTVPIGTAIPKMGKDIVHATVDSDSLGLHAAQFSLANVGDDLYAPLDKATITFAKAYDAGGVNSLRVRVRLEFLGANPGEGTGLPTVEEAFDANETAPGSLIFKCADKDWTITLSNFTPGGAGKIGRTDASFAGKWAGTTPLVATLTQAKPGSLGFSQDATLGITPTYNRATDEPPDNPEVTDDGVFYLRVRGATGPVNLVAKTDVDTVCLTARPVPGQPGVAMTGKLVAVWHTATGNTHYRTITTLYLGATGKETQFALVDDPTSKGSPVKRLLNQGAFKYNQGDMDGAITAFNGALKLAPDSAAAYGGRGAAFAGKHDWTDALADMDRGVALAPHQPDLYLNRGIIRGQKGDAAGAIADFTHVLSLDPASSQACSERGKVRAGKGDTKGALADFDQAIKLDPKSRDAHFHRGNLRQGAGDLDGALADFNKALLVDPQFANAYFNRGVVREAKGDFENAISDLRQFVTYSPTDPNADYAQIFLFLARAGENDDAAGRQQLSDALGHGWIAGPDAWVSKDAAFLLDRMSEPDYLAAANSADPKLDHGQHCEAWFYAGMKKLGSGDNAGAIGRFRESIATGQSDYMEYALAHAQLQALGALK
jgi:lipoprotein NlpI